MINDQLCIFMDFKGIHWFCEVTRSVSCLVL